MQLQLYNTLTRTTETFIPLDPDNCIVTFYSCGPTVYDFAHIGNFRAFLNADVLRRTLEAIGYTVKQIMNITDVGHMTDDDVADGGGEDKMEVALTRLANAKKSGKLPQDVDLDPTDPMAVAEYYATAFMEDAQMLGLRIVQDAKQNPEVMPRPTKFIQPMIDMVQSLVDKGHAYVASDGVVYFDVQTYPQYGELSGNTMDALRSGEGGRVDMDTQAIKRNPADFMLWKPDATHLMRWISPWGEGYPGWHLECSAMAIALLGQVIDIHSGGEDNIFPHHECEIAQSRCATGSTSFANHWFHTRFLLVDGGKMSKSKGNFYTLRDLMKRGVSPGALRLELIRTHYRSNSNFTFLGLKDSQRQIDRWKRLENWLQKHSDVAIDSDGPLTLAKEKCIAAMCEDLNVAGALGVLNDAVGKYNTDAPPKTGSGTHTLSDERNALLEIDAIIGVLDLEEEISTGDIDVTKVDTLIQERLDARTSKDWSKADAIRDTLIKMGVAIKDGPDGTSWSRIVQ